MKEKNRDKRLFIPGDEFEEEASEGLGRLSREEASEDMAELKARMERRLGRPRNIWLPAAAAMVILLVASAIYVSLFREQPQAMEEMAIAGEAITDTALIAMASPIEKQESFYPGSDRRKVREAGMSQVKIIAAEVAEIADSEAFNVAAEAKAEASDKVTEMVADEIAVPEVAEEEAVSEVVVAVSMPRMEKTAAGDRKAKAAETIPAAGRPATTEDYRPPLPAGGMSEFTKWIEKHMKYPEEVSPRTRQMVIVAFRVRADSTVYDLHAVVTPGEQFTAEAYRLLRSGPAWVPATRNGEVSDEETRVALVFK
jgi:hypothetical protein